MRARHQQGAQLVRWRGLGSAEQDRYQGVDGVGYDFSLGYCTVRWHSDKMYFHKSVKQSVLVHSWFFYSPRFSFLAKSGLGAAVLAGALTAGQAQALGVRVNINGQDYNVTTFSGSYNDNTAKFNLPAAGGVMPWWSNGTVAAQFAIAVDAQLGTPNILDGLSGPPAGTGAGPFFGYETNGPNNIMYGFGWVSGYGVGQGVIGFPSGGTSRTWAQVTAVPGPLPVLGAAVAFGWSRKLRKRLKSSKPEVISTTAV